MTYPLKKQWFSKCGPQLAASALAELLEMQTMGSGSEVLESETLEEGSNIFNKPLGDAVTPKVWDLLLYCNLKYSQAVLSKNTDLNSAILWDEQQF